MKPSPITHIGVLVSDLDESRRRWATVLGLLFSPVTRYRSAAWRDLSDPAPHLHDARLSFWLADNPSIEMLEFVGRGTHSAARGEGGHHLAFPPIPDNDAKRRELALLGIEIDGEIQQDGRTIFMFGAASPLNNVYTEWVEDGHDHPDYKDDGSPVNRLPDGSKTLFEVETILDLGGRRPESHMVEVGVNVHDLDESVTQWSAAIGYAFGPAVREDLPLYPGAAESPARRTRRSVLSSESGPRLRLVEIQESGAREGLAYADVAVPDLDTVHRHLEAAGVPVSGVVRGPAGQLTRVDVNPEYTNRFALGLIAE